MTATIDPMLSQQQIAAESDAKARAQTLADEVGDTKLRAALETLIATALMQWWHRGGIDAIDRTLEKLR